MTTPEQEATALFAILHHVRCVARDYHPGDECDWEHLQKQLLVCPSAEDVERLWPAARRAETPAPLTPVQKRVLDFLWSYQDEHGYPPTHREIADEFGWESYGTVHKHLALLEAKGYVEKIWNQTRGLVLWRRAG